MEIAVDELNPTTKCLRLAGRLDLKGSNEIDLRFTTLTSTNSDNIAIDMSAVEFIASIGMRLLLSNAKAKAARGGRMVLFGMNALVLEALQTAGIDSLIPMVGDQAAALAELSA